jgi:methylglutaconyl-CoA hydratase
MSAYETIRLATDGRGVATIALARPEKRNALNSQAIAELGRAAADIRDDETVRAVILAADGTSFCAGADLAWMREQLSADRGRRIAEARNLAEMLYGLNTLPRPVIARVQGHAFGGGLGLIAACDVAIGARSAKFAFTEARLGLIPATIAPYVVARMGEGRLRRVFMSGRIFGSAEARELGLLARVVETGDLDLAIEAEVVPCLSCAPGAVAASKALVRSLGTRIDRSVIDDTAVRLADAWEGSEACDGIEAFLEKRQPRWAVRVPRPLE